MGGAIAGGLAAGNMIAAGDITVTARTARTLDRIKECNSAIVTMSDNRAAVESADLILFAVKPWLLEEIAAGVRFSVSVTHTRAYTSVIVIGEAE